MTFQSLSMARDYAFTHEMKIVVELSGQVGVFEIYPGGRTIKWLPNERTRKKLTPDSKFTIIYANKGDAE